jgi:hypothetical protein
LTKEGSKSNKNKNEGIDVEKSFYLSIFNNGEEEKKES